MITSRSKRAALLIAAIAGYSGGADAEAAAYTWNAAAGGNWSDVSTTGWNTNIALDYPKASGDTATLSQTLTATANVAIDVPGVTLGSLTLGGATRNDGGGKSTDMSFRLTGSANNLTFDTATGPVALSSNGGATAIAAPITLSKDLSLSVTGNSHNGWSAIPASLNLSGAISGNAAITKTGTGTVGFSATNSFVGNIAINGGRLGARRTGSLGNAANVVTVASGATLEVGPGANGGMTLNNPITINGTNGISYSQWGGATLAGKITLGANSSIAHTSGASNELFLTGGIDLSNRTLTLYGGDYASGRIFVNTNGIEGTGSLIVTHGGSNGSSAITLNAPSTYTGTTTVQHTSATLWLNSSVTSNVTVNAGSLRGSGTIDAANTTTIGNGTGTADSTMNAGSTANAIGLFSTGDLAFNSDARYSVEINSATLAADLVQAHGDITIAASAQLAVADLGSATLTAGQFTILQALDGGTVSGVFKDLADGAQMVIGSNTYTVDYQTDRVILAIPEPGTLVGAMTLFGVALTRRRRSH